MSVGKEIVDIIKKSESRETKAYDTTATVTRVEGSTIWVHIPGGVDETPVQKTINANPGDSVQVRVSGGSAWLVGNATAPPTDDSAAIEVNKTVIKTKRQVDQIEKIAGNTNQYFWHVETGTDTGAHITEKPKEDFLADPSNGGGNLLARSNGIAVRDGLTELAQFGGGFARIGQDGLGNIYIQNDAIVGYGNDQTELFRVALSDVMLTVKKDITYGKYIATNSWQTIDLSTKADWENIANGQSFTVKANYCYVGYSTMPGTWLSCVKGTANSNAYVSYDGNNTVSYKSYPSGYGTYEYTYISVGYEVTSNAPYYWFTPNDENTKGAYAFNTGYGNIASGNYSFAEGKDNTASALHSHAEGNSTEATSTSAHAEGFNTVSSGSMSHAEGTATHATGSSSHAEGSETYAEGLCSHAQNRGTYATKSSQTALGTYNVKDTSSTTTHPSGSTGYGQYAVIVGNGVYGSRSNCATIAWNGDTAIAGTLTQGSDRRLKDHISYLGEDAVEFIRQLKPAHYRKDDADHVGFYAQDVESADKWNCMVGEMNGFKTLGYTELIAPLVAYCQSLEKRIEELEGE